MLLKMAQAKYKSAQDIIDATVKWGPQLDKLGWSRSARSIHVCQKTHNELKALLGTEECNGFSLVVSESNPEGLLGLAGREKYSDEQ